MEMEKKARWSSPQSIIIIAIIVLVMTYIAVDAFKTKPYIKQEVENVKVQYKELSNYLDQKIPEIDSALKIQEVKIVQQGEDIQDLKSSIVDLGKK